MHIKQPLYTPSMIFIFFVSLMLNSSVLALTYSTNDDIITCDNGTPAPRNQHIFCDYIASQTGTLVMPVCPQDTKLQGGNCISVFHEPELMINYTSYTGARGNGPNHIVLDDIQSENKTDDNNEEKNITKNDNNPPTQLFDCYPNSIFKCGNYTKSLESNHLFTCYPYSIFKC